MIGSPRRLLVQRRDLLVRLGVYCPRISLRLPTMNYVLLSCINKNIFNLSCHEPSRRGKESHIKVRVIVDVTRISRSEMSLRTLITSTKTIISRNTILHLSIHITVNRLSSSANDILGYPASSESSECVNAAVDSMNTRTVSPDRPRYPMGYLQRATGIETT